MSQEAPQTKKCKECGQINTPTAILCQNCGAPLPNIPITDPGLIGSQDNVTRGGRDRLQQFGEEGKTAGNKKLSRFAEAAARKRLEKGEVDQPEEDLPDWLKALRSGLPSAINAPTVEDDLSPSEDIGHAQPLPFERLQNLEPPLPPPPVPSRPTLPQTGELPDWLRDATSGSRQTGEMSSNEWQPSLSASAEQEVQPFELEQSDQNLNAGATRKPGSGELGGIPEWLREITAPQKQENKPSTNRLQEMPVFEPTAAGSTEEAEEYTEESKEFPAWLKESGDRISGKEGQPARPNTMFGDIELDKALKEAFDETTTGNKKPENVLEDLDNLAAFSFPDFSEVSSENVVPQQERIPNFAQVTEKASGTFQIGLEEDQPIETGSVPEALPWGKGLAPWLRGLELPQLPVEGHALEEPELPAEMALETGKESESRLPDIELDKPPWLEYETSPPITAQPPGRAISLRDLIVQTSELARKQTDELKLAGTLEEMLAQPNSIEELVEVDEPGTASPGDVTEIRSVSAVSGMPEWLAQSLKEPPVPPMVSESANEVELASQLEEEQLPGWLQSQLDEEEPTPQEVIPEWLGQITPDESDTGKKEELPEWLGQFVTETPAVEETSPEIVPEWLGQVTPEEKLEEQEELPEWLQPGEEEIFATGKTAESMPEWLGQVTPEKIEPLKEEENPAWLVAAKEKIREPEQKPVEAFVPEKITDELIPFDLEEIKATEPITSEPAPKAKEVIEAANAEIPEWLGAFEASAEEPGPEEMPEWLKATLQGQAPARSEEEVPRSYSQVGSFALEQQLQSVPEWLKEEAAEENPLEVSPSDEAAIQPVSKPPSASPMPVTGEESQVGKLLREIALLGDDIPGPAVAPDWLQPEKKQEPKFEIPTPADIPVWLKEDTAKLKPELAVQESLRASSEYATEKPIPIGTENFLGDFDAPAWLTGASSPAIKDQPEPPQAFSMPEFTPGQLPSWLRTVAPTATEEARMGEERASERARMQGMPTVILPATLPGVAVLETLLKSPATTVTQPPKITRKRMLSNDTLLRYILFLVLLGAVLIGLAIRPAENISLTIRPETLGFFAAVDDLKPNQKTLLVFDWEADKTGEMRPLSKSIGQHIMSKRARIISLSLNPQGPALANQTLHELATRPEYGNNATNLYEYGNGYINLGYRPGNEAALRSLFQNMELLADYKNGREARSYPVMKDISGLSDFDMIIVLAGDEGSVRTWVEQLSIKPETRLLFATPASVEPFAKPYVQGPPAAQTGLETRFVKPQGLISGLNGASQYEQLLRERNITTERGLNLNQRLNAQSFAVLALVLILVGVNIYYIALHIRNRRGGE